MSTETRPTFGTVVAAVVVGLALWQGGSQTSALSG